MFFLIDEDKVILSCESTIERDADHANPSKTAPSHSLTKLKGVLTKADNSC